MPDARATSKPQDASKRRQRDERRAWLEPLVAAVLSAEPTAALTAFARNRPELNWRRVLERCQAHGVAGVVFPVLQRALGGANGLPTPDVLRAAQRQFAATAMLQHPHTRVLAEVAEALAAAGIQAVAMKGPLLAQRYWGATDRRPSTDLDFLVAFNRLDAAADVLGRLGYRRVGRPLSRRSRWRYPDVKFLPPREPAGAPLIELHWLAAYGCGTRLDTSRLLARAQPYAYRAADRPDAPNVATWVLDPLDELLALAVHGAKHQYERLAWLVDIERLLAVHPALPLGRLWRRARAVGARGVLRYTAAELSRLGIDIATRMDADDEAGCAARRALTAPGPRGGDLAVAGWLARRIHGRREYSVPTKLLRMGVHLALADGCAGRARYVRERSAAALSRVIG